MRVDENGTVRGMQQRIAIGRGTRDDFKADIAARADAVIHDHRVLECFAELLRHRACDHIGAAASGEIDHQPYGFRRPCLNLRLSLRVSGRHQQASGAHYQATENRAHGYSISIL